MKIKSLKLKISLLALFVYIASFAQTANAEPLSLSINPSIIEIHAIPPSTATSALTIKNKSDRQVSLKTELRPFKAKLENGELEYLRNSLTLKNVQLLDNGVPVKSITLEPNQQKKLTLSINIPQNISDYYFSIIFVSDNTSSPTSTSSLNQLGIAANVLLSVGAKETPDAILEEFSTALFYESGPVPFTIRIKNKGAHFIKPKGKVIIKNMFGQSIGKLDLVGVNILGNSIRAIPNDLYFHTPKALWKEDFLLGFYTATLNLSLSSDGPNIIKSIHFLAFPFQGLTIIIIIAVAVIIIRQRLNIYMKKQR